MRVFIFENILSNINIKIINGPIFLIILISMDSTQHSTAQYQRSEISEYMIFCTGCNPNNKKYNLLILTPIYKANSLVRIHHPPPCSHQSKMYSLHSHRTSHSYQILLNIYPPVISIWKNILSIFDCPSPMSYSQDQMAPYC